MAPPSANEVVAGGKDDQVANSGDKPVPVPTPPIVRNLILRSMCGVYLVAFLSFYAQAEGLYGNSGILPANRILANGTLQERLNLLQLAPLVGLDTQSAIDLFCLVGCVIAFMGLVFPHLCRLVSFISLWTLYFSLVQISQSFRQQSDEMLLEAGFLCILLAPAKLSDPRGPIEGLAMLLMKWLLFRYAWVYFPRFDFKFYDASATKPTSQKWLYPMVQRLLQNNQAVTKLFDQSHIPPGPPKFIRASLYEFRFTSWFDGNSTTFWTRERLNDYFPAYSLDDGFLETKLDDVGIPEKPIPSEALNLPVKLLLDAVRNFVAIFEGSFLVLGVLAAAIAMIVTQKRD